MKTSFSSNTGSEKFQKKILEAVIPLTKQEKKPPSRGNFEIRKCKVNPEEADSAEYQVQIEYFSSGTPEEWLDFLKTVERIATGQAAKGKAKFALIRSFLKGDALIQFEAKARQFAGDKDAQANTVTWNRTIKAMTAYIFPQKALRTQTRWMRRQMRKPLDMKIRDYVARVQELNSMLKDFPPIREGGTPKKMDEDELKDIIECSAPNSWRKQMDLQGFDVMDEEIVDIVDMMERIERHEEKPKPKDQTNGANKNNKNTNNKGSKKRKFDDDNGEKKFCMMHGWGNHSTDECKTIKNMLGEKKANCRDNKNGNKGCFNKHKNNKNAKELNALFADVLETAIEKHDKKKRRAERKEKGKSDLAKKLENLHVGSSDSESDSDEE